MEHFEGLIKSINNEQDYYQQLHIINELIKDASGTNSLKPQSKQLLDAINNITEMPNVSPYTKLMALLIAKDLTQKKYMAFVSALSSSTLLQRMLQIAKTVDPYKPIDQKGLNYFPDPGLGNHYMRCIL